MAPDDLVVAVSRVSEKGLVQIPHEVRVKMDLRPGTRMILMVEDNLIVMRKAEVVLEKRESGILGRLRAVFTKLPIKDIEE